MGNNRALDVGEPHRGTGTLQVRKPKVPEGGSDVTVRESPDELTLRAEEVGTSKAYMDVNHIEPERWGPPLVDDWHAFFQALYKGIEGEDWEEMYDSYKAMSKAFGKKAAGGSEGKSSVGHESSQGKKGRVLRSSSQRDHFGKKYNAIGVVGRAPQRPNCGLGQSPKVRGRSVLKLARGFVVARQQWHAIGWCRI